MWDNIEQIKLFIANSQTRGEVLSKLGKTYNHFNYKKLNNIIEKWDCNISHFNNKGFKKGHGTSIKYKLEELFIVDSKLDRSVIRYRIIKENLIEYKCHECGCSDEWRGKKMPLILDHINGINNDNRLENLRFLCSNCDSIQDTYKGRNINNAHIAKLV